MEVSRLDDEASKQYTRKGLRGSMKAADGAGDRCTELRHVFFARIFPADFGWIDGGNARMDLRWTGADLADATGTAKDSLCALRCLWLSRGNLRYRFSAGAPPEALVAIAEQWARSGSRHNQISGIDN